jgi:hypothetical protein
LTSAGPVSPIADPMRRTDKANIATNAFIAHLNGETASGAGWGKGTGTIFGGGVWRLRSGDPAENGASPRMTIAQERECTPLAPIPRGKDISHRQTTRRGSRRWVWGSSCSSGVAAWRASAERAKCGPAADLGAFGVEAVKGEEATGPRAVEAERGACPDGKAAEDAMLAQGELEVVQQLAGCAGQLRRAAEIDRALGAVLAPGEAEIGAESPTAIAAPVGDQGALADEERSAIEDEPADFLGGFHGRG